MRLPKTKILDPQLESGMTERDNDLVNECLSSTVLIGELNTYRNDGFGGR